MYKIRFLYLLEYTVLWAALMYVDTCVLFILISRLLYFFVALCILLLSLSHYSPVPCLSIVLPITSILCTLLLSFPLFNGYFIVTCYLCTCMSYCRIGSPLLWPMALILRNLQAEAQAAWSPCKAVTQHYNMTNYFPVLTAHLTNTWAWLHLRTKLAKTSPPSPPRAGGPAITRGRKAVSTWNLQLWFLCKILFSLCHFLSDTVQWLNKLLCTFSGENLAFNPI